MRARRSAAQLCTYVLCFVILFSSVQAWPWEPAKINNAQLITKPVSANYKFVYKVVGQDPMNCVVNSFEDSSGNAKTPIANYFTPDTGTVNGKSTWEFWLKEYPASQRARITCSDSCGDGVCSGDEQIGTSVGGASCPIDCGCPSNYVWSSPHYYASGQTSGCVQACPTLPNGATSMFSQYCGSYVSGEQSGSNNAYGCQYRPSPYKYCKTCSLGSYDSTGTSGCTSFQYNDGTCRGDLGEPSASSDCPQSCQYGSCPVVGQSYYTCQGDPDYMTWVTTVWAYDSANPVYGDPTTELHYFDSVNCDPSYCYTGQTTCYYNPSSGNSPPLPGNGGILL